MTTTTQIDLVINKLTQAQYNGITTPNSTELYMVTDSTGLTAADVTTALGYTPQNMTSGNTTLGYTFVNSGNVLTNTIISQPRIYAYIATNTAWRYAADSYSIRIPCEKNTKYIVTSDTTNSSLVGTVMRLACTDSESVPTSSSTNIDIYNTDRNSTPQSVSQWTITTGSTTKYIVMQFSANAVATIFDHITMVKKSNVTLTVNSTPTLTLDETGDVLISNVLDRSDNSQKLATTAYVQTNLSYKVINTLGTWILCIG